MTKWLSQYLKPSQITFVYAIAALALILVGSVFFASMSDKPERKRVAPTDVTNIITTTKSRDMGLDAVADTVKYMQRSQQLQEAEIERLRAENEKLKSENMDSIALAKEVRSLKVEQSKLKEQRVEDQKAMNERVRQGVEAVLREKKVDQILGNDAEGISRPEFAQSVSGSHTAANLPVPQRRKTASTDNGSPFSYGNQSQNVQHEQKPATIPDSRSASLMMVIEPENSAEVAKEHKEIYLPKGAMLTGVLITGIDAPTSSAAQSNPMPALVRIKKEAILPNFNTLNEVRECFALMAGYGDLGSERAFFRGESITCVKENGDVIEETFASYAVGEDGKVGLKGTLVTRNSTVLANSMMAGFASGVAAAFDVSPVPVLSTDSSSGSIQYQDNFSSDAAQSGVVKGATNSLEKLADYYMKLADAMHPVIEISSGRVVDMVITKGANL